MLEVKNLTFKVNENGIERSIVKDVSFQVEDGEMLVITGPNGGGKSTLAKVLMGIERADSGQIILDGEDITDYDINHRANAGIGFAFQQPPRFKGMTVMRLLSLAAGREISRPECCQMLSSVGLCANEYITREVDGTLSGGEMKRLEIATVLAKTHKLCIFDEPEAGIDLWSFSMLIQQFEKIHKKIGKKFSIGKVPLKGEPHKMFTFCTRTVYLGADFYSTNARTFIFSDANVETLTVDISLDLPQIMGRQRLVENPWKDDAEFYYKVYSDNNKLSEEEFNGIIQDRINMTNSLLNTYNRADPNDQANVGESYEVLASTGYVNSYLSVNRVYIDADNFIRVPAFNELVKIAQRRAYDIQQIDYADRFAIFSEIDSSTSLGVVKSEEVKDFFRGFEKLRTLSDKLKYYVNYPCDSETKVIILNQITEKHFLEYITVLGEDRVKACSYNISALNKELGVIVFDPNVLINRVYQEFKEGDTISVADLKLKIAEIYKEVGYNKTPKATEILNWFDIKKIKIRTQTGDRVNGFELEKKKK